MFIKQFLANRIICLDKVASTRAQLRLGQIDFLISLRRSAKLDLNIQQAGL